MQDNIKKDLHKFISDITKINTEKIAETNDLRDLGMDSVSILDLIDKIERRLNITIENQELEDFAKLDQAIELIEKRLNEKT